MIVRPGTHKSYIDFGAFVFEAASYISTTTREKKTYWKDIDDHNQCYDPSVWLLGSGLLGYTQEWSLGLVVAASPASQIWTLTTEIGVLDKDSNVLWSLTETLTLRLDFTLDSTAKLSGSKSTAAPNGYSYAGAINGYYVDQQWTPATSATKSAFPQPVVLVPQLGCRLDPLPLV